jgi:hypothetical protein
VDCGIQEGMSMSVVNSRGSLWNHWLWFAASLVWAGVAIGLGVVALAVPKYRLADLAITALCAFLAVTTARRALRIPLFAVRRETKRR